MDGCSYKAAAGGSLSNTLVALARLGGPSIDNPGLHVAMTGSVGSDPLGGFYRAKLLRANVNFSFCTCQGWDYRNSHSSDHTRCPTHNACISGNFINVNYDECWPA
ncbi:hypothetical protein QJS10_CPA10g01150 [Acorus calamus]|uniref:Carbohydrate kinase PfkB domain-containing protein n=1 Tax=Acorus calamus TaxID=4465 RepID=A0AAV9E2T9_ACOCL|nr:hypothetical protein QJS10_CPA10g01150 [Acorus calamus]